MRASQQIDYPLLVPLYGESTDTERIKADIATGEQRVQDARETARRQPHVRVTVSLQRIANYNQRPRTRRSAMKEFRR